MAIEVQDVKIVAHRGYGCTDRNDKYGHRDLKNLPVENTVESAIAGFKAGASAMEIDAVEVMGRLDQHNKPVDDSVLSPNDKIIAVIHNIVPEDHFFGSEIPPQYLNKMTINQIRKYPTGHTGKGEVALLVDMLNVAADMAPHDLPWAVNIELKHTGGAKQPYADNGFLERVAQTVKDSRLPPERVLYSGFSLKNVLGMTHYAPESYFGMLTREYKDGDETAPQKIAIYTDHTDDPLYQYLPYNAQSVKFVQDAWKEHANPKAKLSYMHPEIMTVTPDMMNLMAEQGLGLNVWAIFEKLDDNRVKVYQNNIALAQKKNVPLTIITDYVPEMKKLVA